MIEVFDIPPLPPYCNPLAPRKTELSVLILNDPEGLKRECND